MPICTIHGCTIEGAKGGRSAKATRHVDKEGNPLQPPETAEFGVITEKDAPTPWVQAQRWAMGLPEWKPIKPVVVADVGYPENAVEKAAALYADGTFKPINELSYAAPKVDEPTDLDEANDGE